MLWTFLQTKHYSHIIVTPPMHTGGSGIGSQPNDWDIDRGFVIFLESVQAHVHVVPTSSFVLPFVAIEEA